MKLILLVSFLVSGSVFASDKGANWSDGAKCFDQPKDILWSQPGIPERDVLSILHPQPMAKTEKSIELACRLAAAKWKAPGVIDGLVVAYETTTYVPSGYGGTKDTDHFLMVAVFGRAKAGADLKVVAKTEKPLKLATDEKFVSLDTANYRLSETARAFGVRTSKSVGYSGGGGGTERMSLYIVDKNSLRSIFTTVMSSQLSLAGDWQSDGTRDHDNTDGGTAVIGVLKTKSNGYFDLEKRLKGSKKKRAVYKWTGEVYESAYEDPVADTLPNEDDEAGK